MKERFFRFLQVQHSFKYAFHLEKFSLKAEILVA